MAPKRKASVSSFDDVDLEEPKPSQITRPKKKPATAEDVMANALRRSSRAQKPFSSSILKMLRKSSSTGNDALRETTSGLKRRGRPSKV